MSGELNKGDRVRVSWQNRLLRYQPGDTGIIIDMWDAAGGHTRYYLVLMDKEDPPHPILFGEDEIESIGVSRVGPTAATEAGHHPRFRGTSEESR